MIINVHAGHNPDGKIACGATSKFLSESTVNREIAAKLIEKLRAAGHTVYDCTVNDGTSQSDVLKTIVERCNANKVDLNISIHANSGRNDYVGDGSTGGTEVFIYNLSSKAKAYAQSIAKQISYLGFRLRDDSIKDDVKESSSLYVLRNTNDPALLVECFFIDDKDDVDLYLQHVGAEGMAEAIFKGIQENVAPYTASTPTPAPASPAPNSKSVEVIAREVINGAWGNGEDRTKRLKEAGYSPEVVQNKVNEILKGTSSTPQPAAPKEVWGKVVGNRVNVRKGPGTNYAVVGTVNSGDKVRIWGENGSWYQVDTNKYIYAQYVKKL